MQPHHRLVVTFRGLVVVLGLVVAACSARERGVPSPIQPVIATATTGVPEAAPHPTPTFRPHPEVSGGTPVPYESPTPIPSSVPPTLDPRTPPAPTSIPTHLVPARFPTERPTTLAPTHTPGPTPTNPPGQEEALRQRFMVAELARFLGNPSWGRLAINSVRIQGDWAYLGVHAAFAPSGGGLAVARKLDHRWQIAFPGDPEFHDWLEAMPDSLMTPQHRRFFR